MSNFATVGDIEAFLQVAITSAEQVASANRALAEATAAIKGYTRQQIELVSGDLVTLDVKASCDRLFLPELPVVAVSTVVEDGETLVADDDYQLGQHGILYRMGAYWAAGVQIVQVEYDHGYSAIPDDVAAVCTRAASRAFQAGLRAAETDAVPGVASKSLGDFSVTYSGESGGGVSEGVMGASAARMLLLSEKDTLDAYRVKGP